MTTNCVVSEINLVLFCLLITLFFLLNVLDDVIDAATVSWSHLIETLRLVCNGTVVFNDVSVNSDRLRLYCLY